MVNVVFTAPMRS